MLSLLQQKRLNNRKSTYTSVLNKTNSIQPLLYNNSNNNQHVPNPQYVNLTVKVEDPKKIE